MQITPQILSYVQIGLGVLMIIGVLMQQKGSGLSSAIGGGSGMEYSTKRGAEKFIFQATIVISILFLATSIARLLL